MRIGIDCDGVLANFFPAYERLIIAEAGVDLFGEHKWPHEAPCTWNWPQHYGYSEEVISAVWDQILGSDTFWEHLEPFPEVRDFLAALNELESTAGHTVRFITARPGVNPVRQTMNWLQENGYTGTPLVTVSSKKGRECKTFFITHYLDDKGENIQDVQRESPATRAILLDYPYNQHVDAPRVNSLAGFLLELQ